MPDYVMETLPLSPFWILDITTSNEKFEIANLIISSDAGHPNEQTKWETAFPPVKTFQRNRMEIKKTKRLKSSNFNTIFDLRMVIFQDFSLERSLCSLRGEFYQQSRLCPESFHFSALGFREQKG